MYALFTDETNMLPSDEVRFFIYGGLVVPIEKLVDLDRAIARIRRDAGLQPTDLFKFASASRPDHVGLEKWTEAKRRVLATCHELECKFIVHVIHHEVIKHQDLATWVTRAANRVIGQFNYFLWKYALDHGIVIVDTMPMKTQWDYLREKFTRGLVFPDGKEIRLDRIVLFAAMSDNTSHAASAMDIVLGTFRYCVNAPQNMEAAREMMRSVVRLIWHRKAGNTYQVGGYGWIQSPKQLDDYPLFKPDYEELVAQINALLRDAPAPE